MRLSAAFLAGTALLLPGAAAAGQGPSATEAASERTGGLPDVTVTARRRAEDAQSVPASLSVVGGELIDRSYTVNPQGLTVLLPSLNYSSANPRNTALTIRGLGSSVVAVSQSNDGLEPGVGFYVDQVYHARPATAAFDFVDIEQVEELRGPQGTLFGKNTTAGALNITTRAPSFTPEGFAEVSVGGLNFVQARAYASGPLSETVAFRVSGVSTRRDGFIRNVRTGRDENVAGTQAARVQLLLKPDDRLQLRLIGDVTNFEARCCTQVPLRVGTSRRAAARQYPALARMFGYQPASFDYRDRVTDIDGPLDVTTNEGGLSAIGDLDLGAATLTSVTAWRWWNWDAENDRDYTGLPIQLSQHIPSRQDQYSQELRLASNGPGAFTWVAGLYGFFQKIRGNPISIYGPAGAWWLIGQTVPTSATNATPVAVPAGLLDGYGQAGRTDFRTRSYAGFGEANLRLVDGLTATAGLRYTHETKSGYYSTFTYGGPATTVPALVNARLGVLRPQTYRAADRDGSLSGRGNLAWAISDAVLAYGSYARGFKSGGINMSGLPLDDRNQPALATAVVRPERNTTWEAGVKTRAFDRRLVLNANVYHTRVTDFQATVVDSSQTVALRGYLSNVPRVTVKGVEADAVALVLPGLSLRAGLAYADGRYSRYPAGPCPLEVQTAATAACDLSGRRLASLPRWAVTGGVDYAVPVGRGEVTLHLDTASRSGVDGDPSLSRFTRIPAFNLTNANIGYRFASGLELLVFARNLLDADYLQNVTIQAGNSGLILGTPSEPRIVGATLRLRS